MRYSPGRSLWGGAEVVLFANWKSHDQFVESVKFCERVEYGDEYGG